jgi:exopolyphosphatase/guanosine-5'-triphosphate,3'-diphosphate pyrophosphatase
MPIARRRVRAGRIGVVDIGSNSIRLVVFDGETRAPQVVFNEKVLCGLGRGLDETGLLNADGVEQALGNLNRFVHIGRAMGARQIHMLATAAVRDASNGREFCRIVERQSGMPVRVLSGEEEARLSACGVVAGTPGADGLMGDLGGGSVELVRLEKGELGAHGTLPLGPVRLLDSALGDHDQAKRIIDKQLATLPWLSAVAGRSFYAVGGAWRNLARIHMEQTHYPLHIIHHYRIGRSDGEALARIVGRQSRRSLASIRGVSRKRVETLPFAALLLDRLLRLAQPAEIVFSAYGLREGFLYDRLDRAERRKDPLLVYARELGAREGRLGDIGADLAGWIAPVRPPAAHASERLVQAICHMSDIGWREHPDYRAAHGFHRILHLPAVGWTHAERVFAAMAIAYRYGGEFEQNAAVERLLDSDGRRHAIALGLALRLAFSMSGGGAIAILKSAALRNEPGRLVLTLPAGTVALYGEAVRRRLEALGRALEKPVAVEAGATAAAAAGAAAATVR